MFTKSARFVWLILTSTSAFAADNTSATIQSIGEAQLIRPANAMRVVVEVYCEGSTLRDAIQQFDEQRQAAVDTVVGLGARPDAVRLEDPRIKSGPDSLPELSNLIPTPQTPSESQPTLVEPTLLLAASSASPLDMPPLPGKLADLPPAVIKPTDEPVPASAPVPSSAGTFMVCALLTAEFPLDATTGGERLVQVTELQEQIKSADLPGVSRIRQARKEQTANGSPPANQPCLCGLNQPRFTLFSTLSETDKQRLLAEAVTNARDNAVRLASAAGLKLGSLARLSEIKTEPLNQVGNVDERVRFSTPTTSANDTNTHRIVVTADYYVESSAVPATLAQARQ